MENNPLFELTGTNVADDPFGLWTPVLQKPVQPPRQPAPGMESFSAGEEVSSAPVPEVVTWRITLPAAENASKTLAEGFKRLASAQNVLDSVPGKLDEFIQSAAGQKTVSFSSDSMPEDGQYSPETELLSLINAANTIKNVDFGIGETVSAALEQAKGQFDALLAQVNHEVLNFAWVETHIGGQFIARTSVDWSGDSATIWQHSASPEQVSAHAQALKIAIETRNQRLRMLALVTGDAARIAALLTPGGAIMALPLAYQYITAILVQR